MTSQTLSTALTRMKRRQALHELMIDQSDIKRRRDHQPRGAPDYLKRLPPTVRHALAKAEFEVFDKLSKERALSEAESILMDRAMQRMDNWALLLG